MLRPVHLARQVLVFFVIVKHALAAVVAVGEDFGAVAKHDDATRPAALTAVLDVHVEIIIVPVKVVDAGASVFSYLAVVLGICLLRLELERRRERRGDLPYSGGAQGPSPLATRSATLLYHSSLDLPLSSPMMMMVMLSQPTPPVSLLEARQLSIMFSQIL